MKILIVDDQRLFQVMLKGLFSKYTEKKNIDLASSRDDAILKFYQAIILKEPYDLIVLDINLIDGNGYDVLIEIRKYERLMRINVFEETIVIMTSGDNSHILPYKSLYTGGANYHFIKPITNNNIRGVFNEIRHGKI